MDKMQQMSPASAVTTLADFTGPDLIVPRLSGHDAAGAMLELSQALRHAGRVPESETFYRRVMEREGVASTHIATTIAIPHARLPGLENLAFAFGRSPDGITWGDTAVRLVFLIAIPESESSRYLSLISGLARFSNDCKLLEEIRIAQTIPQMFDIFQQVKLRANGSKTEARTSLVRT